MSTFKRIVRVLEVDGAKGSSYLVNADLLPVPPKHRLWSAVNFYAFWLADSANLSTFMIASSMIGAGMTWWQAWLAVWVGYGIAAVFLVLNAIPGARYHIIFPSYARASWGVYGAMWPVLNRTVCAIVWYGVQAWIGGEATYILIRSIWPSYARLPNGIPSSGTDTAHFVSFFLFSFVSLFAIYFPMHSIRHLFTVKAIVTPAAAFALLGWTVSRGGGGSLLSSPKATISGSTLGWTFCAQTMACLANMSTLVVKFVLTAVDFASRASKPSDVVLPQLIAMPFCFAITSLIGIIIASSTESIFGEFVWSPLDVMNGFLEQSNSSGTRAGCAFISIGFIVAQLGTNISANSLSAGCDTTALLPRFMNIRRGGYLAALVGFCVCPWNLASGSNAFGNYLSAYSVFLSSIAGVLITHYYLCAKQRVKVADLYRQEKEGLYHYKWGINFRAVAAYISGLLMNVVGFAGAVGNDVPLAATRIYQLSFFTGFGVSALVYFLLCKLFPIPIPTDEELDEPVDVAPAVLAPAHQGLDVDGMKRSVSYDGEGEEEKKSQHEDEARTGVNAV
ncbi:hypothetical protein JCM11251_004945 [Rhodosporidiobolus azoricus]